MKAISENTFFYDQMHNKTENIMKMHGNCYDGR